MMMGREAAGVRVSDHAIGMGTLMAFLLGVRGLVSVDCRRC